MNIIPDICFKSWNHTDEKPQRRIVSAANKFKLVNPESGKEIIVIIPAARHYSPIMGELKKLIEILSKSSLIHTCESGQGFIDQFDDYHDRKTSLIIAMHAGQLEGREKTGNSYELFSEDIY